MAVIRQMNWTSQQRVDVPHARMIEQGVVGDFDALAGNMLAGKQPMVVRGFTVDSLGIGNQAKDLTINVANAALINFGATEPGSIFVSPADATTLSLDATRNDLVVGGFTASATNYLGIDLALVADDTTADKVAFLVPVTEQETYQTIDVAKTLKYKFVISTQFFSANTAIVPIAKIVVNSSGVVTSITDCRPMMFRLGSGGDSPSATGYFAFANSRTENSITSTVAGTDPFVGSDKSISSLKEWQDAVMTRIWEVGGGSKWYSPTGPQDVFMVTEGTTFTNNDYFEMYGSNYLNFRGIKFLFSNSVAAYNTVTDYTAHDNNVAYQLADGDVLYVDLQRDTNAATLTAAKLPWNLLYVGVTNPGNRIPIAWRRGSTFFARNKSYPVGVSVPPATTSTLGTVLVTTVGTDYTHPVAVGYETATGTGTVDVGLISASTTTGMLLQSYVANNSAGGGAFVLNSYNSLAGSDLLFNLKAAGTSKFKIDRLGAIGTAGSAQAFTGGIAVAEKATSQATVFADSSTTLTTKGYVDKSQILTSSTGTFSIVNSVTETNVTNIVDIPITLKASRAVIFSLVPENISGPNQSNLILTNGSSGNISPQAEIKLYRKIGAGTYYAVGKMLVGNTIDAAPATSNATYFPPGSVQFIDNLLDLGSGAAPTSTDTISYKLTVTNIGTGTGRGTYIQYCMAFIHQT